MISTEEVCLFVQQEIPEISPSLPPEGGLYPTLNVVREYACDKARERNYPLLRKCFSLAATLYEKGNNGVRCAVENVFVYAMSRILSMAPEDRQEIKRLMPRSLQALYTAQVHHHGY